MGLLAQPFKTVSAGFLLLTALRVKHREGQKAMRIMRSAFSEFSVYEIYKKDAYAGDIKVFMGKDETIPSCSW